MKRNINKTVTITGGSKGIGAAISKEFYGNGWTVFIGARHNNELVKELGKRAFFIKMDVCKENDHIRIVKMALKETGRLDVYINCAGFSEWKPLGKITEKFWNDMLDTNLKGTMWGCKAAAKYLSRKGSIVNISSLAGRRGSPNNSVYCASKFGVIGLTQALAKELGAQKIRVNAVCPVYVETEGVLKALEAEVSPAKGKNIQGYFKKFKQEQSALKKLPTGSEVANVCFFLASDAASAVTGQSLNVDCGVLPQ